MRVFAALPLPQAAAAGLAAAVEPLRRAHPRLRWVPPSAYHLTVHFFGELPDPAVEALKRLLFDQSLCVPAITARFGRLGQFPERGPARVVHASLEQGAEEARAFHDLFHRLSAPLGYRPEARGFSPHVTLARVPSEGHAQAPAQEWETGIGLPSDEFVIGECTLYQSVLGPAGARYIPLAAARFRAPGEGPGS
jgi:RNA 2',3'-cyclic 3'-phosphodiesterase